MSKKKDFEYNGRLDEIKQDNGGNESNRENGNIQPDNETSNPNNQKQNDDGATNTNSNGNESPNIQQVNDDDLKSHEDADKENDESSQPKQQQGEDTDIQQGGSSPNIEDSAPSENQNQLDDDQNGQDFSNSENEDNEGSKDVDEDSDSSENATSSDKNQKDNFEDENDDEDNNDLQQESNDDLDDSPNQDDEDSNSGSNTLKDKAMEKVDPGLAKAAKLKDLTNKSKDQAKEELVEITKSIAKKKAMAVFATYILPVLLPILAVLGILFLILILVLGAVSVTNDSQKPKQEGCSTEDKSSTSIKVSKDADKNAKNIYKYLMKEVKGAKSKAVAAHLGNMYIESAHTFDPTTIQGGSKFKKDLAMDASAGGYALGIAQWDSERRVNLIKFAEKKDKKWDDLEVQLDFMLNHDGSDSETIKKILKSDGSIKNTTEKIMNDWERAGDKSSISERQAAASKYYSKFSDSTDSDSNIDESTSSATDNSDAGSNSGCNTDSASKTDGELGKSIKANGDSGKVLKQWKSKDDIPEKYKKHIELPDYKGEKIDSSENIFPGFGQKGQCTELTFSYMSQLWKGKQPTNGNGNVIYKAYKAQGAKTKSNPTVGYGFSSNPPYAGATTSDVGHTGVVIGVMDDGKWLMSNYNLNGEANKDQSRVETFALVDGNKKDGGITFFSGVGDPKIKNKGKK